MPRPCAAARPPSRRRGQARANDRGLARGPRTNIRAFKRNKELNALSNSNPLDCLLVGSFDFIQGQMLVDLQAFLAFMPGYQLKLSIRQSLRC